MKSSNGGYGNDDNDDNWELWYFLKNLGIVAIAVVESPTVASSLNVNFPTTNSLADSRQLHSSQLNWYRAVGVGKN